MKSIVKTTLFSFAVAALISGCTKNVITPADETSNVKTNDAAKAARVKPPTTATYSTFTIQAGNHSCDQSTIKSVKTAEMKFMAKFDQSAIYTTIDPANQADINKLWGFTEGFDNSYNSARFGWTWVDNALRLHAYVYTKGVRSYKEVTTVAIGSEVTCSIKVSGSTYIFTANGISVTMPRGNSTASASGYQQFPYFGGDEVAPHKITILIKSL